MSVTEFGFKSGEPLHFGTQTMKNLRFYILVFIMATALPSYASYLASEKYDNPAIFPAGALTSVIFVAALITITHIRERRAQKADEESRQP
jgi:hypothetical protein